MKVIPAIDLLDGKVVRLYQGKKESAVVYSSDPVSVASRWIQEGATALHLVDLSASFGEGDNLPVISRIAQLGISIEVGGGIRDFERAEELLAMGVDRCILGTKAIDLDFLDQFLKKFKDKTAVSVDAWGGKLRSHGWRLQTETPFLDFIEVLIKKGINWIIYTDIAKDGSLQGPALENVKGLADLKGPNYIVSGGISNIDDIIRIQKEAPFVWGLIVGKSLYEGTLNLRDAISATEE
jgi:phosphoribosylformimino-5-aminoimidazole carboxamide ribotide isomerase